MHRVRTQIKRATQTIAFAPRAGVALVVAALMGSTPSSAVALGSSDSMAATSRASRPTISRAVLSDRISGCYYGLLTGDALSMPYHWFYSPADITRYHGGTVRDFVRAPDTHPGSIMSLSSTGGAGRGQQEGSVIGDVINKGKKHLWGRRGVHYHHGMLAGENTLNALCARLVVRSMGAAGAYSKDAFLKDYVEFMTTKDSHNDTYAESYHRIFFANWAKGVHPSKCAGDDGHNIATMGGFVTLPPVVLVAAAKAGIAWEHAEEKKEADSESKSRPPGDAPAVAVARIDLAKAREAGGRAAREHVLLTHANDYLADHAELYGRMLAGLLLGEDLREEAAAAGKSLGVDIPALASGRLADTDVVGRRFSPACYIHDAFRGLCFFAHRYADSAEEALVGNTNAGGENCHRGAALGALVGTALGLEGGEAGRQVGAGVGVPGRWVKGLNAADEIRKEAEVLVSLALGEEVPPDGGPGSGAGAKAGAGGASDEVGMSAGSGGVTEGEAGGMKIEL